MNIQRLVVGLVISTASVGLTGCATTAVSPRPVDSKSTVRLKSSAGYYFTFPEGVDWSNATPTQIMDSVMAAVKNNPDAAADIAASGFEEAVENGSITLPLGNDMKEAVDPTPNFWSFRWLFPRRGR